MRVLASALFLLSGCGGCGDSPTSEVPGGGGSDTGGGADGGDDTAVDPGPTDDDGDGVSLEDGDCDDSRDDIYPGADERCDGDDNDCDGVVDGPAALDAVAWFLDADEDGFGDPASETSDCVAPDDAWTDVAGDCDDTDAAVFPGAVERCDDVDNDCDAATNGEGWARVGDVDYDDLQAAIDGAEIGGTVEICAGTFPGGLLISQDVSLVGLTGAESTIIDAAALGPAVQITGGVVTLTGLSFVNGRGAVVNGLVLGGGVEASGADDITVDSCHFELNDAELGGGMSGSTVGATLVRDSTFFDNTASDGGGAFYGVSGTLENVVATENTGWDGGAILADTRGELTISGGQLGSNRATNRGGALHVRESASVWVEDVQIDGNRADSYAGGVFIDEAGALTLTRVVFDNNNSSNKGGAFYAWLASVVAEDSSFLGNSGTWGGAGFLYESTFTGDGVSVQYNTADLGGGFYVYIRSALDLVDSVVTGNFSGGGGGARIKSSSTLSSDNCDWGDSSAENTPDDVNISAGETYTGYGAGETFSCSTETGICE